MIFKPKGLGRVCFVCSFVYLFILYFRNQYKIRRYFPRCGERIRTRNSLWLGLKWSWNSLPGPCDRESQQMQDPMPEPTYQGEPRLGVIPWEGTVRQQHSQRQTTSSSPKYQKPTFFLSWDPEQLKKMPCEKELLRPWWEGRPSILLSGGH